MFNNENDNEYINIEKIMHNDDILKNDYSFKDEEEYEEEINYVILTIQKKIRIKTII